VGVIPVRPELFFPRIDGSTRLVGVMGWPVSHSRSPAMHNAAFAALGLNYVYVPLPVPPSEVATSVRALRGLGFAGVNVTVPHKPAVLPLLDVLTPIAAAIASVNTIVVRADGTLLGDSTDGAGFLEDLRAHRCEPAGRSILLLGAGGAAKAVAYALAGCGATLAVANRTRERADELCRLVLAALPSARITAHPFPDGLARLAERADLVVNATSLGLHVDRDPLPWDPAVSFRPGQIVYDLVYSPGTGGEPSLPTPFLRLAGEAGAQAIDGLGMLVCQGARAFELWTGQQAPVEVMRAAVGRN
jgi:shikimate dehydrogenase